MYGIITYPMIIHVLATIPRQWIIWVYLPSTGVQVAPIFTTALQSDHDGQPDRPHLAALLGVDLWIPGAKQHFFPRSGPANVGTQEEYSEEYVWVYVHALHAPKPRVSKDCGGSSSVVASFGLCDSLLCAASCRCTSRYPSNWTAMEGVYSRFGVESGATECSGPVARSAPMNCVSEMTRQ